MNAPQNVPLSVYHMSPSTTDVHVCPAIGLLPCCVVLFRVNSFIILSVHMLRMCLSVKESWPLYLYPIIITQSELPVSDVTYMAADPLYGYGQQFLDLSKLRP